MVQAYILVRIVPGHLPGALREIQATAGVRQAHAVTGPTDIIAFVEAENMDALGRTIIARLQQTPGVARTTTCVVTTL